MTDELAKDLRAAKIVRLTSNFLKSKKLDPVTSPLTAEATAGFNLACDFLSHELFTVAVKLVEPS